MRKNLVHWQDVPTEYGPSDKAAALFAYRSCRSRPTPLVRPWREGSARATSVGCSHGPFPSSSWHSLRLFLLLMLLFIIPVQPAIIADGTSGWASLMGKRKTEGGAHRWDHAGMPPRDESRPIDKSYPWWKYLTSFKFPSKQCNKRKEKKVSLHPLWLSDSCH